MSRYTREHYEDVARILSRERVAQEPANRHGPIYNLIYDFTDLFAADNPQACSVCRVPKVDAIRHHDGSHHFVGGFDREQFLAACGLQEEVGYVVEPPEPCPTCGQVGHTIGECV